MNIDKTTIIAVTLCVVAYFSYEQYLSKKYPDRFKARNTSSEVKKTEISSNTSLRSSSLEKEEPEVVQKKEEKINYALLDSSELSFENEESMYLFDQKTGGLKSVVLKKYLDKKKSIPIELINKELLIQPTLGESRKRIHSGFEAERTSTGIIFTRKEGSWILSHEYLIQPNYNLKIFFTWQNTSKRPQALSSTILFQEPMNTERLSGSFLQPQMASEPSILFSVSGETTRKSAKDICEETISGLNPKGHLEKVDFIGFDEHYFLKAFIPAAKSSSYRIVGHAHNQEDKPSCLVSQYLSLNQGRVPAGDTIRLEYKAWLGPKSSSVMSEVDKRLKSSLDFGFFNTIAHFMFLGLNSLFNIFGNWGLAIILFTIFLKTLFYPLTRQAMFTQARSQKLKPQMDSLKERYKDNPRQQQQELMKFMSVNKINPMKGCLPLLLQIPVFFSFFRILSSSIELRQAPLALWIQDLSLPDPFYITPLLLGVFMVIQQKLTPMAATVDKTQETIMLIMPVMFTFMFLNFPAGLVVYMLVNTILSIAQQQWIKKRMAN